MKPTRLLALLAISSVAIAAVPQDIQLKRELKEGATDSYLVTSKTKQVMDIPQMGEQEMSINTTVKLAYKFGKVTDGKADLQVVMTDVKVTAEGMMAEMMDQVAGQLPKEVKSTGKIDALGQVSELKAESTGMAEMMVLGSQQMSNALMMITFPDKAIKIGDTWKMPVPDSKIAGIKGASLDAKLVGQKDLAGTLCYEISSEGTVPMKLNISDIAGDAGVPEGMVMSGNIVMKGTSFVEVASGRLVEFNGTIKSTNSMDMAGQGTMNISGNTTISAKLQK
ncbi:MAG TPA: hypothetical protein PLL78_02740 [Fimbriimonadaceae bacterium]|nr:hypothetical protein [Fimbriimonadaceae bacterium]HRJ95577.1 hypothetical protein [Fimbriimonadaceae bacterium]